MCIFVKISYMLCRVNHYEMYEVRVNLIKSGKIRFFKFCCITSGYCGEENAERLFFTSLIKHTPDIPSQGLNIDKVSAFKLPDIICLYSNKSICKCLILILITERVGYVDALMRFSARALRAECFDYDQNKNCFYYTVGHFYNNKNAFKIVCCG